MSDDLHLALDFTAEDHASSVIKQVQTSLDDLAKQAKTFSSSLKKSLGPDLMKGLSTATSAATKFGSELKDAADKAAAALKSDVAAADAIKTALSQAVTEANRLTSATKASTSTLQASARAASTQARAAATAQTRATRDRLADVAAIWRRREASERAEMRHLTAVRRERNAMRREMNRRVSEVYHQGRHSLRSINHPAFESAGFWLTAGAAFGIEAGKHLIDAAKNIDSATTRYSMMPGVNAADAAKVRSESLREGIKLGIDPAEVVKLRLQGLKDGLSPEISKILPSAIQAALQTMGGSIDRDGDELAKAVREASTVGWIRDGAGARSLMNQVAGLSTFNGNDPTKMQQFLASGGIGRGAELGWSQQQTLAFGAALNGSGERTGLGSARLMAQLPEIMASVKDRFMKAARHGGNSEESRAIRSAPGKLGYGSVYELQNAFKSPEGVVSLFSRLQGLDQKTRAQVERGLGLGPQFNAVSAEMGAEHGERYRAALKRENELSGQNASNDTLSQNSSKWSTSIEFMVDQLKSSVEAVQAELGDVIKTDILEPFTKWWVNISEALLDGNMKTDLHLAIQSFLQGLGFNDLAGALNALRGSVGTFDLTGFMRGIGEGLREVIDDVREFAHAVGLMTGGGDARTLGRLAAELLGLSLGLRVISPVVTLLGGIASGVIAIKAAFEGVAILSKMTGLADGIRAIVGIETAATATGLLSIAGGLTAIGAAVQGLMSAGVLQHFTMPWANTEHPIEKFLWGTNPDGTSARPSWAGGSDNKGIAGDKATPESDSYWEKKKKYLHLNSFEGGDDPNNWRNLLTKASYEPSDSAEVMRNATIETARGVYDVRDSIDALSRAIKGSATGTATGSGSGGGGLPNLRYGRTGGPSGDYRTTPGGGAASGGVGGTRSWRNNNPGNIMYGAFAKAHGATGSDGRFATFPDYATGRKAQEDLWFNSPGYKGLTLAQAVSRWSPPGENDTNGIIRQYAAAAGVNPNTPMSSFTPAQRAKLLDAQQSREGWKAGTSRNTVSSGGSFNGGGGSAGKAVDFAMSMQGAGERSAQQILGAYMHPGEWCADFVNGTLKKAGITGSGSAMARSFSGWGRHVGFGDVQKGDVIEETHGRGVNHVGLATGNVQRDRNGNVTAVEMISGNYGHMVRKNWEKIGLIADLRRSNEAVTAAARKVIQSAKPGDIAKRVTGTTGPASSSRNGPTDNSTKHINFHISHPDSKHIVDQIQARLTRVNRYDGGPVEVG